MLFWPSSSPAQPFNHRWPKVSTAAAWGQHTADMWASRSSDRSQTSQVHFLCTSSSLGSCVSVLKHTAVAFKWWVVFRNQLHAAGNLKVLRPEGTRSSNWNSELYAQTVEMLTMLQTRVWYVTAGSLGSGYVVWWTFKILLTLTP